MLGCGSIDGVVCHGDRAFAVTEQMNRPHELWEAKENENLLDPFSFSARLSCSTVLRVIGRRSYQGVQFGVPGDCAAFEEVHVGERGLSGIHTVGVCSVVVAVDPGLDGAGLAEVVDKSFVGCAVPAR